MMHCLAQSPIWSMCTLASEVHLDLATGEGPQWAGWILWLPLISLVLCGWCWAFKVKTKLPAWITVASLGSAFAVTLMLYMG
jgi:hypothetical protein